MFIVDGSLARRAELRRTIDAERGLLVVGEASDPQAAVVEMQAAGPHVILLSSLPSNHGDCRLIDAVHRAAPESRVLVIAGESDVASIHAALDAGASGYILEKAAPTELIDALQGVAAGLSYVHPSLGAALITEDAAERRRAFEDPLTAREREVLRLLVLGHTNREIAKLLFISVRTAESHRSHIMRKLDMSTRAQLVDYSLAHGLLNAD